MRAGFLVTFMILFGTQTRLMVLSSNQQDFRLHFNNRTVAVQIFTSPAGDTTCNCRSGPSKDFDADDYIRTPGLGSHKLHTDDLSWNEARKICIKENAHLAIINSAAEEAVSWQR